MKLSEIYTARRVDVTGDIISTRMGTIMCAPVVDTRDFFAAGNFKAERPLHCCRKFFQHKVFPLTGNWALAWNVMCAPVVDIRDFLQQEISRQKCTCTVAGNLSNTRCFL